MKKRIIISFLISVILFTSCVIYTPVKDYTTLLNKTSYKSFTELNNPIVFRYKTLLDFELKNGSDNSVSRRKGSYYFIYDEESKSLFDYLYVPYDNGIEASTLLKIGKNNKGESVFFEVFEDYRSNSYKLFFLDSSMSEVVKKEISKVGEDFEMSTIFSIVNSSSENNNFIVLSDVVGGGYFDLKNENRFTIIDASTKEIVNQKYIKTEYIMDDMMCDSSGTIWFSYIGKETETESLKCFGYYNYITDELNKNCFELTIQNIRDEEIGTINSCNEYNIKYSDENILIIEKKDIVDIGINKYTILVIEKNNNPSYELKEISLENYSIKNCHKYNNEYYFFAYNNDNVIMNKVFKMNSDGETKELSLINCYYENYYCNQNRIYLINEDEGNFSISYYDILLNEFVESGNFDVNDFLVSIVDK